jgi:hypothetical protein
MANCTSTTESRSCCAACQIWPSRPAAWIHPPEARSLLLYKEHEATATDCMRAWGAKGQHNLATAASAALGQLIGYYNPNYALSCPVGERAQKPKGQREVARIAVECMEKAVAASSPGQSLFTPLSSWKMLLAAAFRDTGMATSSAAQGSQRTAAATGRDHQLAVAVLAGDEGRRTAAPEFLSP